VYVGRWHVDDIIITCPDKSKILNLNVGCDSLQYLGWNLKFHRRSLKRNEPSVNKAVLILKPTSKGIKRIKIKMKSIFKLNMPLAGIINKLNPIELEVELIIIEFLFTRKKYLLVLSKYQYTLFLRWVHRTHPQRSKRWIIKRYIQSNDTHKWLIGNNKTQVLLNPVSVLPVKTAAMKTGINPYTNKEYYTKRFKILDVDKFRKAVYNKHNHTCAACGEILRNSEATELHHIIPRKDRGKYTLKNIVPLHRPCHLSVTYARSKWKQHLRK